jgi:hypothetical protein
MVKMFPKSEEKVEVTIAEASGSLEKQETQSDEQGLTALLTKTRIEEADLQEQRKMLTTLRENLIAKAKEEIESRKSNVETLKSEIAALKLSCEVMNRSLNPSLPAQ